MRVFISWSKEPSKTVAVALARLIKDCINAAEPWLSPDIPKGMAWGPEIMAKLVESKVGIVCLTEANKNERWLLFEAGAIMRANSVQVLQIDFAGDVGLPLSMFQTTQATEEDVYKLLGVINDQLGPAKRPDEELMRVFKAFWPELKEAITYAQAGGVVEAPPPDVKQMLAEMLSLTRNMASQLQSQQSNWSFLADTLRDAGLPSLADIVVPMKWAWSPNRVLLGAMAEALAKQPPKEEKEE
jgi:hypothetical protein